MEIVSNSLWLILIIVGVLIAIYISWIWIFEEIFKGTNISKANFFGSVGVLIFVLLAFGIPIGCIFGWWEIC